MNCPSCNKPYAYVGFHVVECMNYSCKHFSAAWVEELRGKPKFSLTQALMRRDCGWTLTDIRDEFGAGVMVRVCRECIRLGGSLGRKAVVYLRQVDSANLAWHVLDPGQAGYCIMATDPDTWDVKFPDR